MPAQKVTRPKSKPAMLQRALLGGTTGEQIAHQTMTAGIAALEKQTAKLTQQPTVTGSKGGNTALASLMSALVQLGIVKDGTT